MRRESSCHFPKTEFQPPLPEKQSNMHHFIPGTLKPKIYKKKKKTIIQNLDMNRYRLELTLGVNAKNCSRMPNNMKEWVSKNKTNTNKLLYLSDQIFSHNKHPIKNHKHPKEKTLNYKIENILREKEIYQSANGGQTRICLLHNQSNSSSGLINFRVRGLGFQRGSSMEVRV